MDSIWIKYTWTLLILIGLEGILSADNALVIAVIARHLPDDQKKAGNQLWDLGGISFSICFYLSHIVSDKCLAGPSNRCGIPYLHRRKTCL